MAEGQVSGVFGNAGKYGKRSLMTIGGVYLASSIVDFGFLGGLGSTIAATASNTANTLGGLGETVGWASAKIGAMAPATAELATMVPVNE